MTLYEEGRLSTVSRILIIAGVLLLVGAGSLSLLYFSQHAKASLCNILTVPGSTGGDTPATAPQTEWSIFPPGVRCSFYAGVGKERVEGVNDGGFTVPGSIALILITAGIVTQVRFVYRQTRKPRK